MTDLDLDALEAAARAATEGPWTSSIFAEQLSYSSYYQGAEDEGWIAEIDVKTRLDDAAHIAAFDPPTALALISAIRRLQADKAKLEEALNSFVDMCDSKDGVGFFDDEIVATHLHASRRVLAKVSADAPAGGGRR